MPFKDASGFWRDDKPSRFDVEWDTEDCPVCGSANIDFLTSGEEIDLTMADAYDMAPSDPQFQFVTAMVLCYECEWESVDRVRLYWNPTTADFDLPRMVAPKVVAQLERAAQERAGQLVLPIGEMQ